MPTVVKLCLTGVRFFFFQAEDGIRDHCVTGVQTCALPISVAELMLSPMGLSLVSKVAPVRLRGLMMGGWFLADRKSTRLNSSHTVISYAVFCLKKKKSKVHTLPNR